MTLGKKLLATFLLCGLVPTAVVSALGYYFARSGMEEVATQAAIKIDKDLMERLEAVRENKAISVSNYFGTIEKQVLTFSQNPAVVEAMKSFPDAFREYPGNGAVRTDEMRHSVANYYETQFGRVYAETNGTSANTRSLITSLDDEAIALQYAYISTNPHPLGSKEEQDSATTGLEYDKLHAAVHPSVRTYLREFGYYDIFLVDIETGDIVYSVFKELDYATSLLDGPYASTNFAEVYKEARTATSSDEVFFADFRPYTPSYEAPASFVASAIFDGQEKVGVAVFQMPLDQITAVMSERAALGETGEAYLVGPDNLMRSDSYRDPQCRTVMASFRNPSSGAVKSEPALAALRGETGTDHYTNYAGVKVISAYRPLDILGEQWAMLVEITDEEGRQIMQGMVDVQQAEVRQLVTWMSVTALLTAFAVTLLGLYMTRSVNGPLSAAVGALSREAENVNTTAMRMSASSRQLAESARTQAASLEETSSSLEELSAMTSNNAENATEANSLAVQARGSAEQSDQTIASLRDAISKINDSSARISSIIKVIEDIAFQTNLLALNAAVEAARAGDHGKGFAVVADEVRNLAQKATAAAQETSTLIEDSVGRAREGSQAMEGMEKVLDDIVRQVTRVSELMDGISSATSEQARGVEQISRGAERMDQVTQQTAASAEGTSTLSQELSGQAAQVRSVVNDLETLVGSQGSSRAMAAPSSRLVRPGGYDSSGHGEMREAA